MKLVIKLRSDHSILQYVENCKFNGHCSTVIGWNHHRYSFVFCPIILLYAAFVIKWMVIRQLWIIPSEFRIYLFSLSTKKISSPFVILQILDNGKLAVEVRRNLVHVRKLFIANCLTNKFHFRVVPSCENWISLDRNRKIIQVSIESVREVCQTFFSPRAETHFKSRWQLMNYCRSDGEPCRQP